MSESDINHVERVRELLKESNEFQRFDVFEPVSETPDAQIQPTEGKIPISIGSQTWKRLQNSGYRVHSLNFYDGYVQIRRVDTETVQSEVCDD